ncbi:MAG TPA: DUF3488 and transglutaminase-like domain-containing protein, partial [Geobacteraceae bacterium]|nr:DUF3488 and transglutaminase-like domain-containing protein [Geobacteraceae bacterium]
FSPVFLAYLLVLLLCIAASLVLLTFFSVDSRLALSRTGMKRLVAVAVSMPVAALPLILVFFIVMPRPQFPLWDFLAPPEEKTTGLSDTIVPGSTSRVRGVKKTVLRVQSPELAGEDLYWRGIVLNTPRGNAWVRTRVAEGAYTPVDRERMVSQTVFPEPDAGPYLVVLDAPVKIRGIRTTHFPDQVFTRRSHGGRIRYDTVSSLEGTIQVGNDDIDRPFYLALPPRISSRVKALGGTIAAQVKTDRDRLARLEEFYRGGRFRYATSDLPRSGDAVDEFLFENRAGHCELFATSFVTVLRVAGVPSRLVGGYYGGDYNEMAGYYLVTEDMAHVWVEVYLAGIGWVRRDPSAFSVNYARARDEGDDDLIARIRKYSDSFSYYWNLVVINYDLDKQLRIFRSANTAIRTIAVPAGKRWLLAVLFSAVLTVALFRVLSKRWGRRIEERLLRRFLRRIAKRWPRFYSSSSIGLLELAQQIDNPYVREFAEIYCGCVYRDRRPSTAEIARLRELVSILERSG